MALSFRRKQSDAKVYLGTGTTIIAVVVAACVTLVSVMALTVFMYAFLGVGVLILYFFLAGGFDAQLLSVLPYTPIIIAMAAISGFVEYEVQKKNITEISVTWVLAISILIPIALYWLSYVFSIFGYTHVAEAIFAERYMGMKIVIAVLLLVTSIILIRNWLMVKK